MIPQMVSPWSPPEAERGGIEGMELFAGGWRPETGSWGRSITRIDINKKGT
jgi:hypothetical protein